MRVTITSGPHVIRGITSDHLHDLKHLIDRALIVVEAREKR